MEAVQTILDLNSQLMLNVNVSGLGLQTDLAAGFTGIEHVVFNASATLGGVSLSNQIAFATPFASLGVGSFTSLVSVGSLLFVTERAQVSTSFLGVSLTNLAIVDDVNFMHPFSLVSSGSLLILPHYTAQSQSFGFGDIVTLQGQTVSGVTLSVATGFNASPNLGKSVKGASFSGGVVGANKLGFIIETISLQNLMLGPVSLGSTLVIDTTANPSKTLTVSASFSIQPGATRTSQRELQLSFGQSGQLGLSESLNYRATADDYNELHAPVDDRQHRRIHEFEPKPDQSCGSIRSLHAVRWVVERRCNAGDLPTYGRHFHGWGQQQSVRALGVVVQLERPAEPGAEDERNNDHSAHARGDAGVSGSQLSVLSPVGPADLRCETDPCPSPKDDPPLV
jgi:hypothetical protein